MATFDVWLDLSLSAVDEELGAGDEACVGGSEEDGGASNLPRITNTPERGRRGQVVEQALLLRGIGAGKVDEARRLDRARADDVDADAAKLEIKCPAACKVAHCRLRGAVNAERGCAFDADVGSGKDPWGAVDQQGPGLLHRK